MAKFKGFRATEENSTVIGTSENDSITVGYDSVIADGGAANDVIYLSRRNFFDLEDLQGITVTGGEGSDTIKISPDPFRMVEAVITDFTADDVLAYESFSYGREITYSTIDGGIVISDNQLTTHIGDDEVVEEIDPTFSVTLQGVTDINTIADAKFYRKSGLFSKAYETTLGEIFNLEDTDSDDTEDFTGLTVDGDTVFVSDDFDGEKINLANFDSTVTKINATTFDDDIYLVGNDKNNILLGGDEDDTIIGNLGDDTLSGGNGEDIFIHTAGNDIITDYKSGDDIIQLDENVKITASSVNGGDVILTTTDGTITLEKSVGKEITFIDSAGNETVETYGSTIPDGLTKKGTKLTADKKFNGDKIDLEDFGATRLDARKVRNDIEIFGTDDSNSIRGGKSNDTIIAGDGDDTLTGGKGNDIFVHSEGDDIITDYKAGQDKIQLDDTEIKSWRVRGRDVIFSTEDGSITVKNGKGKNISIVDEDGNESARTYKDNRHSYWFATEDDNFAELDNIIDTKSVGDIEFAASQDTISATVTYADK